MAFLEMYLNGQWQNLSSFGTVSSVDIQSSNSAISVTGSPITSVGIINLSFNSSAIRLDQFAVPTSNLDINNKNLINVATPTLNHHATNKSYVDTRSVNDLAAPIATFSMNNNRIISVANPTSAQDVATKNYVDAKLDPASIYYCRYSEISTSNFLNQNAWVTIDFVNWFTTKRNKDANFISFDNGGNFTVTSSGLYKIDVAGRVYDGGVASTSSTGASVYRNGIQVVENWSPVDNTVRRSFRVTCLVSINAADIIQIRLQQIGSSANLGVSHITLSIIKLQ